MQDSGVIARVFCALCAAVTATTPAVAGQMPPAQHQFIAFDVPGAGTAATQGTEPVDMNILGVVAGRYIGSDGLAHGFLRLPSGKVTPFDVPGTGNIDTVPSGINALGYIVGTYTDAAGIVHGFMRAPSGAFRTIDAPGAGNLETVAYAINDLGAVAGAYTDATSISHAYLLTAAGVFSTITPTGAATGAGAFGFASSVNDLGVVNGEFLGSNQLYRAFVRAPGASGSTSFDAPGAGTSPGQGTFAGSEHGLNLQGDTAGSFADSASVYHGYLRHGSGAFTEFDAPAGSMGVPTNTFAVSINLLDAICGYAYGTTGIVHGFLRSASGTVTLIDAPAASSPAAAVVGTYPLMVNALGAVTGIYQDAKGVEHGFVWLP